MKRKLLDTPKKKIIAAILAFMLFIIIISIIYFIFFYNKKSTTSEDTGGNYTPKNTAFITNSGVLYKYLPTKYANNVIYIIKKAIVCNQSISISNDKSLLSSEYTITNDINSYSCTPYKNNKTYVATIDKKRKVETLWYYKLGITVKDGRHFTTVIDLQYTDHIITISIKKD